MKRLLTFLLGAALLAPAASWSATTDAALKLALRQAVEDTRTFDDPASAKVWLADMSNRLQRQIPNPFYRLELLRAIHEEATRAGIDPELVLAVVQVESHFDRFAISAYGARGLMQVMPFWKKEIGHPRDNLFHPQTNLRYGCTVLSHYLRQEKGNLGRALARYNGSLGMKRYPAKVFTALKTRWSRN
jgi:soluble lytic murein transglycosylase-like protein